MGATLRDVTAVGAYLLMHFASVTAMRYLVTQGVADFKLAMLLAVVGTGAPAALLHEPWKPEGGEIELVFTAVATVRTFFTYYAYVFSSMGSIAVGMAESLVMMAILQYLLAEKTVTWRRQITVGGVVAAMVFMAGALAAGTGVGLSGWVFAMVMGFSMAMYDTLVELAGRYGYKPVALFSRATMRANALALLAALALGWEDPAEAAALDGYQWTAMALTALATAGFSVLGPWISFEISPSMTDATEQLSVTLGFLVDVLAFGSDFTALEAVGAALVLVTVLVFFALEAVEQSDEHKAHEQLFERWRDPTGTWPYAARFGAAALVVAVVLGAGYVPALLGAGPTQTRFAARRR